MSSQSHQDHGQAMNGARSKLDPSSHLRAEVAVVIVPLPAQGHLNQLLQLSRLISSYGVTVHYVGSPTHIHQVKLRSHHAPPSSDHLRNTHQCPNNSSNHNLLHFHDFAVPPFAAPAPNPYSPCKFPSHLLPAFETSSSHLRSPVASLIRSLSSTSRRVIVVHDSLMGSAVQDAASVPNAETYAFHTVSAFALSWYIWEAMGKKNKVSLSDESIKKLTSIFSGDRLPSLQGCFSDDFLKFMESQYEFKKLTSGSLQNTSRVMEADYLDLLEKLTSKKHWAIGPFNPIKVPERKKWVGSRAGSADACINWLDAQAPNSVIFVSFGTTTTLSDEQVNEIALGLEMSEQKFIWVLRDADRADIFREDQGGERKFDLPKGYNERVRDRDLGLVVREWAPQLGILAHASTGGFLSHCGWNSCMESLSMGVPILAWTMHSDQPRNAVLLTRVLGIGLAIEDYHHQTGEKSGHSNSGGGSIVSSATVRDAVKALMASREGDETRAKAAALGETIRRSMDEGGVSRSELESFVAHICR